MDARTTARLQRALAELVTLRDFAAAAGLAESTVQGFRTRGRLPEPLGQLGSTPVWAREQLDAWLSERGRRAGMSHPAPSLTAP